MNRYSILSRFGIYRVQEIHCHGPDGEPADGLVVNETTDTVTLRFIDCSDLSHVHYKLQKFVRDDSMLNHGSVRRWKFRLRPRPRPAFVDLTTTPLS